MGTFDDRIQERFGPQEGWMANAFQTTFESNEFIQEMAFEEMLSLLKRFIDTCDLKEIVFFPDRTGWKEWRNEPVSFRTVDAAISFLADNVDFGVYNYYISDREFTWAITICHEEDLHISGTKEFTERFRDLLHS